MITQIGLQNTIAAIERLDEECTSLFNHYDKDKDLIQNSIIAEYAANLQTKSELNSNNAKYEKSTGKEKSDLDVAREKAEERTLLEMVHINNNADDIANVYSVYKRGLDLKREILIENKIFELIVLLRRERILGCRCSSFESIVGGCKNSIVEREGTKTELQESC